MTNVIPLSFEGTAVRGVMLEDGLHFSCTDVCRALGYVQAYKQHYRRLAHVTRKHPMQTGMGRRAVHIMSLAELHEFLDGSKYRGIAERFRNWAVMGAKPWAQATEGQEAKTVTQDGAVVPFDFNDAQVRVVMRNGEPWFVLADVCRVLEIANSRDAASRLDEDEKDTVGNADSVIIKDLGVVGAMPTLINESGLYHLIFTSRKEEAKVFRKWVTGTVLPTIRKTGSYGRPGAGTMSTSELALAAIQALQADASKHDAELAMLRPKALQLDRILQVAGEMQKSGF